MLKAHAITIIAMKVPACLRDDPTDLLSPDWAAVMPVLALAAIIDQITTDMPLNMAESPKSELALEALSLP